VQWSFLCANKKIALSKSKDFGRKQQKEGNKFVKKDN
jgi:hypothetical protein